MEVSFRLATDNFVLVCFRGGLSRLTGVGNPCRLYRILSVTWVESATANRPRCESVAVVADLGLGQRSGEA